MTTESKGHASDAGRVKLVVEPGKPLHLDGQMPHNDPTAPGGPLDIESNLQLYFFNRTLV